MRKKARTTSHHDILWNSLLFFSVTSAKSILPLSPASLNLVVTRGIHRRCDSISSTKVFVSLYHLPLFCIMKLTLASLVWLWTSSASAFAPSFGSSFTQNRAATRLAPPSSSSTALQMNLFDRFTRVAKSNLNNILKNLEDPEKIMNQAVEDMQVREDVVWWKRCCSWSWRAH